MQIGTIAKKIGLSIDAIRFYERSALLRQPPRSQGGFRQYGESDIETLAFIRRVQGLGFKLREIREVLVSDARMADQLRFCGSPTIRINGRDVGGEARNAQTFALSCRLYAGSKQVGLPPAGMIRRAVLEARQRDKS